MISLLIRIYAILKFKFCKRYLKLIVCPMCGNNGFHDLFIKSRCGNNKCRYTFTRDEMTALHTPKVKRRTRGKGIVVGVNNGIITQNNDTRPPKTMEEILNERSKTDR